MNHHVGTRDLFRRVKTKIDPKSGIVALHKNVALARVVSETHALAVHVAIGLVTYRSSPDAASTCDSATAHSAQVQQRPPLTVVGAIDQLRVTPTPPTFTFASQHTEYEPVASNASRKDPLQTPRQSCWERGQQEPSRSITVPMGQSSAAVPKRTLSSP